MSKEEKSEFSKVDDKVKETLEAAMKEQRTKQQQPEPMQFAGQTEIIVPAVIISNMIPPPKPKFSLAALAKAQKQMAQDERDGNVALAYLDQDDKKGKGNQ